MPAAAPVLGQGTPIPHPRASPPGPARARVCSPAAPTLGGSGVCGVPVPITTRRQCCGDLYWGRTEGHRRRGGCSARSPISKGTRRGPATSTTPVPQRTPLPGQPPAPNRPPAVRGSEGSRAPRQGGGLPHRGVQAGPGGWGRGCGGRGEDWGGDGGTRGGEDTERQRESSGKDGVPGGISGEARPSQIPGEGDAASAPPHPAARPGSAPTVPARAPPSPAVTLGCQRLLRVHVVVHSCRQAEMPGLGGQAPASPLLMGRSQLMGGGQPQLRGHLRLMGHPRDPNDPQGTGTRLGMVPHPRLGRPPIATLGWVPSRDPQPRGQHGDGGGGGGTHEAPGPHPPLTRWTGLGHPRRDLQEGREHGVNAQRWDGSWGTPPPKSPDPHAGQSIVTHRLGLPRRGCPRRRSRC